MQEKSKIKLSTKFWQEYDGFLEQYMQLLQSTQRVFNHLRRYNHEKWNEIRLDAWDRKEMCKALGLSEHSMNNSISQLIKYGLMTRITVGRYIINPHYLWHDSIAVRDKAIQEYDRPVKRHREPDQGSTDTTREGIDQEMLEDEEGDVLLPMVRDISY